mgnify:CR=1 FL=1
MGNRIVISEYDRLLAKYRKVLPLLSLPENPSVPLMAIPQRAETPKLPPIPQLRPPIVSPPVLPTPPQPEIPQLPPIPPPPSIPMGLDQLSAAAQTGIGPIKTTPLDQLPKPTQEVKREYTPQDFMSPAARGEPPPLGVRAVQGFGETGGKVIAGMIQGSVKDPAIRKTAEAIEFAFHKPYQEVRELMATIPQEWIDEEIKNGNDPNELSKRIELKLRAMITPEEGLPRPTPAAIQSLQKAYPSLRDDPITSAGIATLLDLGADPWFAAATVKLGAEGIKAGGILTRNGFRLTQDNIPKLEALAKQFQETIARPMVGEGANLEAGMARIRKSGEQVQLTIKDVENKINDVRQQLLKNNNPIIKRELERELDNLTLKREGLLIPTREVPQDLSGQAKKYLQEHPPEGKPPIPEVKPITFPKDINERIIAGQDLRDMAKEQNYKIAVNPDGSVSMWHGTSKEKANNILTTGKLETQSFLSPNKKGSEYYAEGKAIGGESIQVKVDARDVQYSTGTGEVFAPDGLVRDTDGIWKSPKRIKPPATIGSNVPEVPIKAIETPKPGITTPETGIGQIPPQKPPAPPMPPAGVNPEDEFYKLLDEGKLAEAETKIKAMPKEKHLTIDSMQQWFDDAKALKEGKPLPTQTIVKIKAPEATGPIRKSQMNLKQYGLDPKDEEILVERLKLDKSTQTWEDTQNWLDTMSSDDIKRIAKSRQEVLPSKEFKAMVQLSSTNTREIARLAEMLKFPSMRKEALKRIGKLKSQMDMALAKSSTSLTEAGRILNLSKMVMKKTFNPDYWVIQARQIAGRDLSTDVVNKIVKLSEAKNGDELAYMLSNLKKGMTDEAILGADLSKELKAIKEERKRLTYPTTPDIDPKKDLQKLSETIRKEYGYPIVEKEALLQDIKTSQQLVTKERNVLIDMALRQEARTRKPAEWLTKATEIAQKPLSPEIRGAIIKAVNTKDGESLRAIIESLTPQTKWDKIANIIGIPRTIMSSVDLSAPFRQGVVMVGRPEFWKSLEPMLKSAFSQKYYDDMIMAIKSGSSYNLKKKVGLGLTEMGTKISAREEAFMSRLAEKIPIFGRVIKGSNRAYSAFLNKLRSDVFDTLYQQAIEEGLIKGNVLAHTANPDKIIKDISTFINNATGRGELPGGLNESTVLLNSVFFSPRLMASRVNMLGLNPTHYITMHPFVRRQAVTDMIKFAGTGLMTLTLAKLAGANIETDPHSSDFGQIRVGNTRYDIWGGFRPYVVLVARMLPEFAGGGKIKSATTGRERLIGKGYNAPDRLDLLENFLLGKGAPVASLISTFMKGKDFQGKPVNYPAEVMNRFIPMIAQDMYELYKEYGPAGLAMGLPSVFGVGVNTFSRKKNTTIGSDVTGAIDGVQTSTGRGETSDYYKLLKEYGGGNGGKSSDSDYYKLLKEYGKE